MELFREASQRIVRVLRLRACRVGRHLPGTCMTVPQALQVRCETLE